MPVPEPEVHGLRSLLQRTNFIFHRYNGLVIDHGEYLSVATPDNPGYYWGNCLIYRKPPAHGDEVLWRQAFRQRFGADPAIQHETFTWDSPGTTQADVQGFLEQGFQQQQHLVMTADRLVAPIKYTSPLLLRPFAGPDDWEQVVENDVLIKATKYGEQQYRDYRTRKNRQYRRMIDDGLGLWFGAFVDGKLAGDLGLFWEGTIGRFQIVNTHPDYRRQGICSRLLYFAGDYGMREKGLQTLVIVADPVCVAKDVYAGLGFRAVDRAMGLEKLPVATSV